MDEAWSNWLSNFDPEEQSFIKEFLRQSGSLKKLSAHYNSSYPTIRMRLDRIIAKLNQIEKESKDPFEELIFQYFVDGEISGDVAKKIIKKHREEV